jgi:hypothetical protein
MNIITSICTLMLALMTTLFSMPTDLHKSTITYEQATEADIDALMELYCTFTADDYHKLLVLPAPFHHAFVLHALRAGRIFVARDTRLHESKNIIAFIKLFIVTDATERQSILHDELRLCNEKGQINTPLCTSQYEIDTAFGYAASILPEPRPAKALDEVSPLLVYYGGAFTLHHYRDQGINSGLEQFAINHIMPQLVAAAIELNATSVAYTFGVVKANAGGTARLRSCTYLTTQLAAALDYTLPKDGKLQLTQQACHAFKPTFYTDDKGALAVRPDNDEQTQAGAGYGVLIDSPLFY